YPRSEAMAMTQTRLSRADDFLDTLPPPSEWPDARGRFGRFGGQYAPETLMYHAQALSEQLGGAQIWLKREDLAHTGAHKINNALGQGLLAKRMGKPR